MTSVLLRVTNPVAVWSFSPIHHKSQIELEPSTRFARIEDTVHFKNSRGNCEPFYLIYEAEPVAVRLDPYNEVFRRLGAEEAPDNREKGIWPSNPVGPQKVFKGGHPRLLPEQKPLVSFKPFPK